MGFLKFGLKFDSKLISKNIRIQFSNFVCKFKISSLTKIQIVIAVLLCNICNKCVTLLLK